MMSKKTARIVALAITIAMVATGITAAIYYL